MKRILIYISIIVFSIVSCKKLLLVNPADPEATNYQGFPYYEEGSVPEGSILSVTGVLPRDGEGTSDITPLLSWDDIKNAPRYQIQFSKTEAGLSQSEPITLETSEYQTTIEDNLEFKNTYYWRIRIVNGGNLVSPWSLIFRVGVGLVVEISGYVFVDGGIFTMGSNDGDSNEAPTHSVAVDSFYISKYEVTQGEYEAVMGENPSKRGIGFGDNYPVNTVNWYDAVEYANELSKKDGLTPVYSGSGDSISMDRNANGYRLPTEAEWEYAARGGESSHGFIYSGSNRVDDVAWYSGNSGRENHLVGGKQANELGLYDMSGNVAEWVWDWGGSYSSGSLTNPTGQPFGSDRVSRSGSWLSDESSSRITDRYYNGTPSSRYNDIGFRLALSEGIVRIGSITGMNPTDGSSTVDTTPQFTWNAVDDAIKYEVQIADTQNDVETATKYEISTNSYTPSTALIGDQTYYWRVRAINSTEAGSWSTILSVVVVVVVVVGDYVLVEGGTFQMGSTEGGSDEEPVHSVTVGSFYISRYEVTQGEYESLMGSNPSDTSYGIGDNNPVNQVSWNDTLAYANALSTSEGLTPVYTINGTSVNVNWNANGYRLPTEAEWEYAARGGNASQGYIYSGSNTIGDVAWYDGNSGDETHPVGEKQANELGLYDMSGNVAEWVWDQYGSYSGGSETDPTGVFSGFGRVFRGGNSESSGRLANRSGSTTSNGYSYLGFRLVLGP